MSDFDPRNWSPEGREQMRFILESVVKKERMELGCVKCGSMPTVAYAARIGDDPVDLCTGCYRALHGHR